VVGVGDAAIDYWRVLPQNGNDPRIVLRLVKMMILKMARLRWLCEP
jgi:hypothetical protein